MPGHTADLSQCSQLLVELHSTTGTFQSKEASVFARVKTGDALELMFNAGNVKRSTTGATLWFLPYPEMIMEFLEVEEIHSELCYKIQQQSLYINKFL